MSMDSVPLPNATWPILGASNETVLVGENGTRSEVGEFTTRVGLMTNSTDVGGDSNLVDKDSGVWWEGTSEGGDFPVVKFGPDLGFLEPLAVYINLLMVLAATVLVIAVACRCVAAKVRLSMSGRRGPEISFHLEAKGDVIKRVVSVVEHQCDGDGFGQNDLGDSHQYEVEWMLPERNK